MNTLRTEVEDGVMVLTFHRPEKLNTFTEQMLEEFLAVLDQADHDDRVRVLVVTGEGQAFCAGFDLEEGETAFEDTTTDPEEYKDTGGILALRLYHMQKPVIAAINGAAVGVGITMTLPMDIRIASTGAKMGFVFASRGIVPESCSSWFLPRIVGISKASEWVYTGKIIKAEEAFESGLVNEIVSPEELLPAAIEKAKEIAERTSAVSVALSRQLMWRMLGSPHPEESHELESKMIYWMGRSADAKEGVNSFLEKRKPVFSMKVSSDMPPFYPWWTS
ncbi:crotonase/enoyl-CoA hydratase family protein [Thalassobacillus sp. C254]|uniref:crotonase/enoyl-CoA hydratase family protein n=1 Tax=Thalassobacillus sp. C254 TaxID=1225341 RepID=UPI0006D03E39|nr:crotonase/enoyl-CoA hydratase family protein [Thalassobacillus sp. C254]